VHLAHVLIFREREIQYNIENLIVAHEMILRAGFDAPIPLSEFRALQGILHFIYSSETIYMKSGFPLIECGVYCEGRYMFASYTEPGMKSETFVQYFNGTNYIVAITEMEDGVFFISYLPDIRDISRIYFLFIASAAFIFIGFLTAKVTTIYIAKPLSELENFTKKIAAKDWSEPLVLSRGEEEHSRIANAMNEMQETLRRADEGEKEFFQNISHDLKTPTMIISSLAKAVIDGVRKEPFDKTVKMIWDESMRLNKMIEQILFLSTLDYVLENKVEASVIELDKIVIKIVGKFEVVAGYIECDDSEIEKIKIKGNDEKLTIAIENIWDNAVRHALSQVAISLKQCGKFARIEIFNDGENITPERLVKIFDSMYKGEKGAFGLGLPITKKIVKFYGGTVWAENRPNGVSFVMEFPVI